MEQKDGANERTRPPLLELEEVSFSYGKDRTVIKGITLRVESGPFVAILGPNGAGKSTLLKILAGILEPYTGRVEVEGTRIRRNTDVSRLFAYVPQFFEVALGMRVVDFVLLGRPASFNLSGKVRAYDVEKSFEALEQVGCRDLWSQDMYHLSGGERQKVMIAKALAQDTEILLIDEPITHLDLRNQVEVLDLLRALTVRDGKKIISVMHDVNYACRYTDYTIFLKEGLVFTVGESKEAITRETVGAVFGVEVEEQNGILLPN
jgi:iron complex transport system ATP-binding protein